MTRRKRLLATIVGTLLAAASWSNFGPPPPAGQQQADAAQPPAAPAPVKLLPTADDYVGLALADLDAMPFQDQPYIRYLALTDADSQADAAGLRTCSLTMNIISRASGIVRPAPAGGGRLVRVDLRHYAPRAADLAEWLVLWEELAFDPTFSLLITRDTVNLLGDRVREIPRRRVKKTVVRKVSVPGPERLEDRDVQHPGGEYRYPDDSGRVVEYAKPGLYTVHLRFRGAMVEKEITEEVGDEVAAFADRDVSVIRLTGQHLDPVKFARLQAVTASSAPIVEHRYFKTRVLSTVKDAAVFKDVWGGLYYEFRGVKKAKDVLGKDTKATDLDLFFESVGVGNIKAGLTADQQFERLRSDQRAAIFRSGVTGKPRIVEMFHTLAEREGNSWGAITDDIKDGDVDIGDRGFANLLKPRIKAREALFPGANGFQIATLWNGDGARQDEVPPDVAADATIPAPFTRRLQGAISCLRCHTADGSDGYKPVTNDVTRLTAGGRIDIFDDLSGKRLDSDTIDRLVGLYAGDFSKHLRRSRDDQAEAFLKASGPWKESQDQADAAKVGASHLCGDYAAYNYSLVDARAALADLGFDAPTARAPAVLRKLLPPDLRGAVGGIVLEDPRLAAILNGVSVTRADWALVYAFAAERARRAAEAHKNDEGGVAKWLEN